MLRPDAGTAPAIRNDARQQWTLPLAWAVAVAVAVAVAMISIGSCAAEPGAPSDRARTLPQAFQPPPAEAIPRAASMQVSAEGRIFYIRGDGGSASECTGLADAPRGPGTEGACAWAHPFFALPPGGHARIAAGDTLYIGSGNYMIGPGAPGAEQCRSSDCIASPVPSGTTSTARTRVLGRSCAAPPTLWGSGGIDRVINLEGSSNVEIGCLEITDRHDCVYKHSDSSADCPGQGRGHWAKAGLFARGSSNVLLRDLDIHGLAAQGIRAGGLENWTVERVKLIANGRAGWDGNVGSTASANTGTIEMRGIEIAWNGCGERWQTRMPWACWAQQAGGYGDGLGTTHTGGRWLIEDAHVHHNTSDGLDLRYMDGSRDTTVIVRRLHAVANAGNQIKVRGNSIIENSVIVGHCGYFSGKHFMREGDQCRAGGNAVQLVLTPGASATMRHNTIASEGGVLIGMAEGDGTAQVTIQNNVLIGFPSFRKPQVLSSVHYANNAPAPVHWAGNLVWNVKNGKCPSGSICGKHPRLASMLLTDFDAEPLAGSPVVDRVRAPRGIEDDFRRSRRPTDDTADIGAIEARAR